MNSQTLAIAELADQIRPLLAGRPAEIQGATLADLLALWLAGHMSPGNPAATAALREGLLRIHIEQVRALIPVNAAIIGTEP